jgi:hypothetical protein
MQCHLGWHTLALKCSKTNYLERLHCGNSQFRVATLQAILDGMTVCLAVEGLWKCCGKCSRESLATKQA